MGILEGYEPQKPLKFFEEISAVPRGSLQEDKIADYLVQFAEERGLPVQRDACNNVLIKKAATPGYEKCDTLILQGHSDMVCAREDGVDHDFEKDGLELYVDDGLIRARGTTLGADNGIGLAYGLAVLDSTELSHPALEVVFTAAEEIGMVGAGQFDMSWLSGKKMISFDSGGFTEGRIYVGCAGGEKFTLSQPLEYSSAELDGEKKAFRISVSGLLGGHSGGDISKGRGNASVIMGRLLHAVADRIADAQLLELQCGDLNNPVRHSIPDRAAAIVSVKDGAALQQVIGELGTQIAGELGPADPHVQFGVEQLSAQSQAVPRMALSPRCFRDILDILLLLPDGVASMHKYFTDTPETSCNVGSVEQIDNQLVYYISSRSSKESGLDLIDAKLQTIAQLKKLKLEKSERIPGWDYQPDSELKQLIETEYTQRYGEKPRFKITHASTECGMFKRGLKDLDVISIGPIIYEEHTTREYMEIVSVNELWKFLCAVLKKCKDI